MVSKEWAVAVVERHLADLPAYGGVTMVVMAVRPHRLGWVVHSQTERYARTRDMLDMAVGHGPFIVDGVDGSLHQVHATATIEDGSWIDEYLEAAAAGLPVPGHVRVCWRVSGPNPEPNP
ncbi:YrhB family protein [Amycolatopsis sp. OK19-0408]|uniref:YrhB family protein n=1 Tax=Amycolatopsis iheyensis TaxID=2945988 RepID=A0A9X2N9H9_9PSEU|nr:YrhB family protein [Amycolatopsis iheyensis]MCR6482900.1 YrhB family protein [Amycolatopsis iheyensis]